MGNLIAWVGLAGVLALPQIIGTQFNLISAIVMVVGVGIMVYEGLNVKK